MTVTIFRRAALLASALALVVSGSAGAAVKPGNYRGKTQQGAAVSLKVLNSKKAIIKFTWEGAALGCSDNQVRNIDGGTTGSTQKISLSRSGKYGFNASLGDAGEFATQGRVSGNKVTGALQVQAKINEQEALDPNGAIFCDSDIVPYTLKRR
jgi:hypothetical protein